MARFNFSEDVYEKRIKTEALMLGNEVSSPHISVNDVESRSGKSHKDQKRSDYLKHMKKYHVSSSNKYLSNNLSSHPPFLPFSAFPPFPPPSRLPSKFSFSSSYLSSFSYFSFPHSPSSPPPYQVKHVKTFK